MTDFLFPLTDGGVAVQLVAGAIAFSAALALSWSRPEIRILVIGVGVFALGFAGVRAIH